MRRTLMPALVVFGLLLALTVPAALAEEAATVWQLADMEGQQHDLDAVLASGHNVVFVFWQTWCGPCKREAPHLAAAAREHASGLQFVGVVSGSDRDVDDAKVRKYVEKYALPYPQVRDRDLSLVREFEVKGTPTIVIVGPGHEILYRGSVPPDNWSVFERSAAKAG